MASIQISSKRKVTQSINPQAFLANNQGLTPVLREKNIDLVQYLVYKIFYDKIKYT